MLSFKEIVSLEKDLILVLVRCIIAIPVLLFYSDFGFDSLTIIVGLTLIFWIWIKLYEIMKKLTKTLDKKRTLKRFRQVETIKVPITATFKKKDGTFVTFKAKRITRKPSNDALTHDQAPDKPKSL